MCVTNLGWDVGGNGTAAIARMVERSVTVGTREGYERSWKKWVAFLGTVEERSRPDMYLDNLSTDEGKGKWMAMFIAYLHEVLGIRGKKTVHAVLTGVRFHWKKTGRSDSFFASSLLSQVAKGARRTTEELRERAEEEESERMLPAFIEMMMVMRKQLWEESGDDTVGLDMKAVYLSAAVAFDMGLRPGNVTLADGPRAEDHCIRARNFRFRVVTHVEESRLTGGEQIRGFLNQEPGNHKMVQGVDVVVPTGKTQRRSSFSHKAKSLGRGNVWEELLLEDLCEFNRISGVKAGDEFVTRYAPGSGSRKVVTAKGLREAVKAASRAFGLPAVNFSAKSLRSGFATHMTSCGIAREDMVARAGWSIRSRVPEGHYIRSFSRGAFGAALDENGRVAGVGVEGIRRMLPPGTLSVDRRAVV